MSTLSFLKFLPLWFGLSSSPELIESLSSESVSNVEIEKNENISDSGSLRPSSELIVPPEEANVSKKTDCFVNFFDSDESFGIVVPNSDFFREKYVDSAIDLWVVPPSKKGHEKPKGCSMIDLSYDLNRNYPNWSLRGEFTLKNEKVGLALWVSGNGSFLIDSSAQNSYFRQTLEYRLAFLENEEGDWKVRGGYHWDDSGLVRNDSLALKVVVPEGEVLVNQPEVSCNDNGCDKLPKLPPISTSKKFFGEWIVDEKGKGIFEDFSISNPDYFVNPKEELIILGWNGESSAPLDVDTAYDAERKEWFIYKDQNGDFLNLDSSKVLKKWFEPFKGKKGIWKKSWKS